MVELTADPWAVDPARLIDTVQVAGTWLGGRRVDLDAFLAAVGGTDNTAHATCLKARLAARAADTRACCRACGLGMPIAMIKKVFSAAGQILDGLGGILGIRIGTEEPHYVAESLTDSVEIRRYGPRVAAETTVFADDEAARSTGFQRLAGYIFGGNRRKTTIAMTAPVAQRNETIAMTAPVVQAAGPDGGSVIRFFMPAKWSMATLPEPNDENVRLVEVPAETFAVLRFSGDRGPAAISWRTGQLMNTLRDRQIDTNGEAVAWFYDPPWTVPFRRRNEVAVPIDE